MSDDDVRQVRHRQIVDQVRARAGAAPSQWAQAEIRARAIRAARERRSLTGSDLRVSLEAEQRWLRVAAHREQPTSGALTQRSGAGLATVTDIATGSRDNVLSAYGALFDTPTTIDSIREGLFVERVAPTAFDRTLKSGRRIVSQYDHGHNARVSTLPLGPVKAWTDAKGLRYDVDLLTDASYVQDILPAARAGLFSSSFRFQVIRDEWRDPRTATAANPDRLAERVLLDVELFEVGPVLFPAYQTGPVSVGKPKRSDAAAREVIAVHHRRERIQAIRDQALSA